MYKKIKLMYSMLCYQPLSSVTHQKDMTVEVNA